MKPERVTDCGGDRENQSFPVVGSMDGTSKPTGAPHVLRYETLWTGMRGAIAQMPLG